MNHGSENPAGRKRPRDGDGGTCELMPISKRINDLHIESVGTAETSGAEDFSHAELRHSNCNVPHNEFIVQNEHFAAGSSVILTNGASQSHLHPRYRPELDASTNPYYYYVNGTLFEAHIQRMLRMQRLS